MDSNTEIRRPRCGWERQSGGTSRDRFGQSMEPARNMTPGWQIQPVQAGGPMQQWQPAQQMQPVQQRQPMRQMQPVQQMQPAQQGQPAWPMQSERPAMPAGTTMPWMQWNMSCPNTGVGPLEQNYPAARAYVPWQQWQDIYEPETALAQGTIFPDMDLPFEYGRCGR